jgi:hypothetical protein
LYNVLSKVIFPLSLGERVRVRGKKDISNGHQNTFHPTLFPPPSRGRDILAFVYVREQFFIRI